MVRIKLSTGVAFGYRHVCGENKKGAPGTHTGVRLGTHTRLRARVSPAPFCDGGTASVGTVSVGNPTPQGIRLGSTRLRASTGKE